MSLTYYTPEEADGITFTVEGRAILDVLSYTMKS
jgi:hypothetical protein